MSNLVCSKRDESIKNKKLRREGFVPAIIYGKNLDETIKLQIPEKELSTQMKTHSIGSQIVVAVDGEEYETMIKAVTFIPMSTRYQHVDFQVLTSGEKIKSSFSINFINKDKITMEGNVQEYVHTVDYEVLPKDMIESVDVDLSVLTVDNDIKVSDMSIFNDERYNILTADNTTLVSLASIQEVVLETEDTAEVAPVEAAEEE